jgi:hypothetical protein
LKGYSTQWHQCQKLAGKNLCPGQQWAFDAVSCALPICLSAWSAKSPAFIECNDFIKWPCHCKTKEKFDRLVAVLEIKKIWEHPTVCTTYIQKWTQIV